MMGIGFQTGLAAVVADLLAVNRKQLEDIRYSLSGDNATSIDVFS